MVNGGFPHRTRLWFRIGTSRRDARDFAGQAHQSKIYERNQIARFFGNFSAN
jgi:hypothetical protein